MTNNDIAIVIVKEALAILDKLGSSDAIADFFEVSGIKGRQEDEDKCPIANWLNGMLEPTGEKAEVFQGFAMICDKEIPYGEPISTFTLSFDWGKYPTLIESDPLGDDEEDDDDD